MAEIHIERKSPKPWVWVCGVLAVLLVIWAIAGAMNRNDRPSEAMVEAPAAPAAPASDSRPTGTVGASLPSAEVASFATFVEAPLGSNVGVGHEYTADGIRRLANALGALAQGSGSTSGSNDQTIRQQLAELRQKADRIQAESGSTEHAERVREAFEGPAGLMSSIQRERWPEADDLRSQVADARAAADKVEPGRPLLDQTETVQAFFGQASRVVRAMADQQPT